MKMNYRKWLVCGLIAASVCIGVDSLQAQDNGGNPPPAGQIKDLLTKYQASLKTKQAALETAQANLRAVLTSKQEAQATLLGLLN